MKINSLLVIFVLLLQTLSAQIQPNLYQQTDSKEMNAWVDSVYSSLTHDQRIGQLFMVVVENKNTEQNKRLISQYIRDQHIGGILFSKGTIAFQAALTNYAQNIAPTPLLIGLDGEWGLNMRLTDAPKFPRNMVLGAIKDDSLLYLYGREVARQCKELGIHANFAPVLDINSNPKNPVIGSRAFGETPELVTIKGLAYAKGLEDGGIMAVAKHFPGHGDTADDSHRVLPTINHARERLEEIELFPFISYINAGLSGMMIGHLNIPSLRTKGMPSSLVDKVGRDLLKDEMGFSGLTFTDGMAMRGVSRQESMSVKAILAGNDIVLGVPYVRNEYQSVKQAVKEGIISEEMIERKVRRVLSYKFILGANKFKPINGAEAVRNIQNTYADWLIRKLHDNSIVLLQNKDELLPIKELDKTNIATVSIGSSSTTTFQKWINKYAPTTNYQVAQPSQLVNLEKELQKYDLVIFSIHSNNFSDSPQLLNLLNNKKSALILFTSPYNLERFTKSADATDALVLAHTNDDYSQISAAQALFGGIAVNGVLPVSSGKFKVNDGLNTEKTRLSYQLPEEIGIKSENMASIERIALEGIRQKAYPGCQILIAKDGVVIYERAFGNLEYGVSSKVTDETVYDLASITKATATLPAIMKLYDNKIIKIQDPLQKFIPETKNSNKANVTIKDALLHESGIVPYIPYYTFAIDENSYVGPLLSRRKSDVYSLYFSGMWGRNNYKFKSDLISPVSSPSFCYPVSDKIFANKNMQKVLLEEIIKTNKRPKRYAYSCLNFMLLKEVVENITKQDLNEYSQANFFKRLGAYTTTFQPLKYMSADNIAPTENDLFFRKQILKGYVHDEGAALFGGISGNAGLFSNANDIAKLYQMFLNGGIYGGERYLSDETVKFFTNTKSGISRRGLGFDKPDVRNNNASPTSPQAPVSVYGHTGFTGTSFWIDPTNKMIYIFLSNRVFPSRSPNRLATLNIRKRIQDELYNAIKK